MKQTYFLGVALLALGAANGLMAAPFQNGGFENPTVIGGNITFLSTSNPNALPGWTHSAANSEFRVCGNQFGILAAEGNCYLGWGANGLIGGVVSQTFDTVIGNQYTITYQLTTQQLVRPTLPLQSTRVEALSGAQTLASVTNTFNMVAGDWQQGTALVFIANSVSTTLRFTDLTLAANSGPINWGLDNVLVNGESISNVPEPSTYAMAATGLGLLAYLRRRK